MEGEQSQLQSLQVPGHDQVIQEFFITPLRVKRDCMTIFKNIDNMLCWNNGLRILILFLILTEK